MHVCTLKTGGKLPKLKPCQKQWELLSLFRVEGRASPGKSSPLLSFLSGPLYWVLVTCIKYLLLPITILVAGDTEEKKVKQNP